MPTKGTFSLSPEKAVKQGLVPAAPIARVIEQWCTENWWMDAHQEEKSKRDERGALTRLADFTGVYADVIVRIKHGRKDWVEFDNADRIITFINPMLWMTDPELRELYQGFDFAWLDLNRPTCEAVVDEVFELASAMPQKKLAALYGVSVHTVQRALSARREPLVAA